MADPLGPDPCDTPNKLGIGPEYAGDSALRRSKSEHPAVHSNASLKPEDVASDFSFY